MKAKRVYIVTGKGGVGKSTLAMSLCLSLKNQGHNVLYHCFDQMAHYQTCRDLNIETLQLDLEGSVETYIGKKLKSPTVAKWIMMAPFFKSTFAVVPALGHVILLGHIVDILEERPNLSIVIDSPSSGHTMSMLEATKHFKKIFQRGAIVDDIDHMEAFLAKEEHLKILIASLPTEMSIQEAKELDQYLTSIGYKYTQLVFNEVLSQSHSLLNFTLSDHDSLPIFLNKKLTMEKEILEENLKIFQIPLVENTSAKEVVEQLQGPIYQLL